MNLALPTICTVISAIVFFSLERLSPAREFPHSNRWYARAVFINLCQIAITLATNKLWVALSGASVFGLARLQMPLLEGFIGWFVGTFFFYWWHRLRHQKYFWEVFHQLHHSPARIEAITSFYKHPVEILADSALAALVSLSAAWRVAGRRFVVQFFAATGELFYHSNLRPPSWTRYFIQTPQLHSIHHQLDVHHFNYADLPVWDRLFGTYRDTEIFADRCGFPRDNERWLSRILMFRNVYDT